MQQKHFSLQHNIPCAPNKMDEKMAIQITKILFYVNIESYFEDALRLVRYIISLRF